MRRHLTYANVMATIGVFLALGGVSYAAIKLPANSVGTKQIKDGAVSSADIKNHSIKPGDFKGGLPKGPEGPKGDRGPAAVKYWAQISAGANPTVLNSSGGVTVTRGGNLQAHVTFPADISKCAVLVQNVISTAGRHAHPSGRPTGATLDVWTESVLGAAVTTTSDPFDVAVFC